MRTRRSIESHFEFIDYNSGTLISEQIPAEDYKKRFILDVVLPPYSRTRAIRNIALADRCQLGAAVQPDAA
jgi:BarA-like signal transduction histidine kinase